MKNQKIIQIVAKIGKILSQIVFVCCIVAASLCTLALLSLILMPGIDITSLIMEETNINTETIYVSLIVAVIVSGSEIYIALRLKRFFAHELEVMHPFTHELASELKNVAWITIIINLIVNLVCNLGISIARLVNSQIKDLDVSPVSIGFGITLLIVAFLCDYAADINNGYVPTKTENTENENNVAE